MAASMEMEPNKNRPQPGQENGRFYNPWTSWRTPSKKSALYWMMFEKDRSHVPTESVLNETLPIIKPNFSNYEDGLQVTWLGHATVLVQIDGFTVLTDPIFSQNASPVPFMASRFRPVPCNVSDLPKIDVVLISHNHYDHLDSSSVQQLCKQKEIRWLVPHGLKNWMESNGCINVEELKWWEEATITPIFRIACTPAQHWSQRGALDLNKSLWASWCVLGPKHRFFFAGDTGYPTQQKKPNFFDMIREDYGPFDAAAIPIGAYAPRWMMQEQHVDPEQAIMIHRQMGARNSIAIHWGTFRLANEPYLEPKQKLEEAMRGDTSFTTVNHGETKIFTRPSL